MGACVVVPDDERLTRHADRTVHMRDGRLAGGFEEDCAA
jgi:hypothetical protein